MLRREIRKFLLSERTVRGGPMWRESSGQRDEVRVFAIERGYPAKSTLSQMSNFLAHATVSCGNYYRKKPRVRGGFARQRRISCRR